MSKKVPVTLVIHTYEDFIDDFVEQDDWEECARFFIEENHCLENYITKLASEQKLDVCTLCSHAEAFVGHIPFEDIRKVQR